MPNIISDPTEAVAEAWASIDGKLEQFRDCKNNDELEDYAGYYGDYMTEAKEFISRVEASGWVLIKKESAE